MGLEILGYAFLGGLLPSFIWLYFLLQEDSRCPEPRSLITLAFAVGAVAVLLALPLEQYVSAHLASGFPVITGWAMVEEVLKYGLAAIFILWRKAVDESPDYVIYMLTVALGFAAAENTLFLFNPTVHGQLASEIATGNLRFLGSTLLHVLASSAIGFAMALSFHLSPLPRVFWASLGLILAIALHTTFNMLIIMASGTSALGAFFLVWSVAVVFFAAFEILKYFRYRNLPKNVC